MCATCWGAALTQPTRSPGASVLANEPRRTTVPRAAMLHSEGGAGVSYQSSR